MNGSGKRSVKYSGDIKVPKRQEFWSHSNDGYGFIK
jgi:hypothetical protein